MSDRFMGIEEMQECLNDDEKMGELMAELYSEDLHAEEREEILEAIYEPAEENILITSTLTDGLTGNTWTCTFNDIDEMITYLSQYKKARLAYR